MYPQVPYGQPQYQQVQYPQNSYQYNQQQMPQYIQQPTNQYSQQPMIPTEVIDWDGVSSIDPELVRRTGDLTQLQPFISRFVSTNLSYESQVLQHPLSVRLCSILQVSLQYMSDVQKQLQQVIEEKDRQISKMQLENKKLKESCIKSDNLIQKLMKPCEKCPICFKKYLNYDYLDLHFERRHPEHMEEWLSIRNKRPAARQNNDIVQMMEKIEALQNTIRKDRERKSHRGSHHRREKDHDENIKTLRKELYEQQDQLMATEAIQDELSMTQRQDIQGALDTAVDELNSSWLAWNKKSKSKQDKKKAKQQQKPKTKMSKDEEELNNMYNNQQVLDELDDEDELNPDNNFSANCNSSDLHSHNPPNVYEEINNPFHFDLYQNNYNAPPVEEIQEHPLEKEQKKDKKSKKSFFKKSKNKDKSKSQSNESENIFNIPVNQQEPMNVAPQEKRNVVQAQQERRNVQKPPSKKKLSPEDKDLLNKARQFVIRKFTPTYDDSILNHSKHRIEKKLKITKQKFGNDNVVTSEFVSQTLQDQSECDPKEYLDMKRKVTINIEKEAPVKHCTFFDSTLSETSLIGTSTLNHPIQNTISEDQITEQTQIDEQTPMKTSEASTSNGNSSTKRKRKRSFRNAPVATERQDPVQRNKKHCKSQGYPIGKITPKVSQTTFINDEPEYEYYYVDEEEDNNENNQQFQPEVENENQQDFVEEESVNESNNQFNNDQITSGQISISFNESENKSQDVRDYFNDMNTKNAKNEQVESDISSDPKRTQQPATHVFDPNDSIDAFYIQQMNNEESHQSADKVSHHPSENTTQNLQENALHNTSENLSHNSPVNNTTQNLQENSPQNTSENLSHNSLDNSKQNLQEISSQNTSENLSHNSSDNAQNLQENLQENESGNENDYDYYGEEEEEDNEAEVDELNKTQRSMNSNHSEQQNRPADLIQKLEMMKISDSETDSSSFNQEDDNQQEPLMQNMNQQYSSSSTAPKSSNSTQNMFHVDNEDESSTSSFSTKQNFHFLASKYGQPPSAQQQQVQNRPNRFLQNMVFEDTEEIEQQNKEEYSDPTNEQENNSGDLIDDIFKAPSGSFSLKDKTGTASKSKLNPSLHKTFVSSSADPNEFDYNRGPPMNHSNYAPDEDLVNYNEQSQSGNENESYFKSAGEYESDENGPPVLSRRKDPNSIISNDDFNL